MIKSELVSKLTEQNPHLYQRDIEQIVNAILDTISDALAQGGRVELRGSAPSRSRSARLAQAVTRAQVKPFPSPRRSFPCSRLVRRCVTASIRRRKTSERREAERVPLT
jgi:nucleoid DNA-binding protein